MKIVEIDCCGEEHRIGVDVNGERHFLDCDLEQEETREILGEEPSQCYKIHIAIRSGHINQSLCNAVCRSDAESVCLHLDLGANIHWSNNEALRLAVIGGDLDIARLLIKRGANVNDSIKKRLWGTGTGFKRNMNVPILEEAQRWGPIEMVKLLKDAGATEWTP